MVLYSGIGLGISWIPVETFRYEYLDMLRVNETAKWCKQIYEQIAPRLRTNIETCS